MSLELKESLRKYVRLTEDGQLIERFICPVEGCNFSTRLGPGALRMHILLRSDPKIEGRYSIHHEEFYNNNQQELGLETVRYLHSFPRVAFES